MSRKLLLAIIIVLFILLIIILIKDPIKKALGIPYPWNIALTWFFVHANPSISNPPKDFQPISSGNLNIDDKDPQSIRIAFLGDIMPLTSETKISIDPKIQEMLSGMDAVVLNCEAPLGTSTKVFGTRFQMSIDEFKRIISELGIDPKKAIVSVANNHTEDYGTEGLKQTKEVLESLGSRVIGMYSSEDNQPIIATDIGDIRIGFAAWTNWRNRPTSSNETRPYITSDIDNISQEAIAQMNLDMLIGYPHWDLEFRHFPQNSTKSFATELTSKGFDLIVGHHPHVIQGGERINNSLVFYSCGNAISNEFCAHPWPGKIGQIIIVEITKQDNKAVIKDYLIDPFIVERTKDSISIQRFKSLNVESKFQDRFDFIFPAEL